MDPKGQKSQIRTLTRMEKWKSLDFWWIGSSKLSTGVSVYVSALGWPGSRRLPWPLRRNKFRKSLISSFHGWSEKHHCVWALNRRQTYTNGLTATGRRFLGISGSNILVFKKHRCRGNQKKNKTTKLNLKNNFKQLKWKRYIYLFKCWISDFFLF